MHPCDRVFLTFHPKMPIQVDGEVMELAARVRARTDIAHQVMRTVL